MWGQTGREKRGRDLAEPCLLCNLPRPLPCPFRLFCETNVPLHCACLRVDEACYTLQRPFALTQDPAQSLIYSRYIINGWGPAKLGVTLSRGTSSPKEAPWRRWD